MGHDSRLSKLEAIIGRQVYREGDDPEAYCDACLGPRAYRLRIDSDRARLKAKGWNPDGPGPLWLRGEPEWPCAEELAAKAAAFVCRGCGSEAETYDGAIARIRKENGLA